MITGPVIIAGIMALGYFALRAMDKQLLDGGFGDHGDLPLYEVRSRHGVKVFIRLSEAEAYAGQVGGFVQSIA